MKRYLPIIIGIVVLVGAYFMLMFKYSNGALEQKQNAEASWSNVEKILIGRNYFRLSS